MARPFPWLAKLLVLTLIFQIVLSPSPFIRPAIAAPPEVGQPTRDMWVEEPGLRTAYSKHFRAGEFMVAELYAEPVHRQENGRWVDVDGQPKPRAGGGYETLHGRYRALFTDKNRDNAVVMSLEKGRSIKMGLDEDLTSSTDGRGQSSFRTAVAKSKMSYREDKTATEFSYDILATGIKETITINHYSGKNEFRMPLELEGLVPSDAGNGSYLLLDRETGQTMATIPAAFAHDAAGVLAPAVTQSISTGDSGAVLTIWVDPAWLQASDRKFPVVIDPSVYLVPETQEVMAVTVSSHSGPTTSVQVMNYEGLYYAVPLIKFDLTSIPTGAYIYSAKFDVERPFSVGTVIDVLEVADEWFSNATWTSPRGGTSTWPAGGISKGTSYGNLTAGAVEISSLVRDWVNRAKPNQGIALRRGVDNNNYGTLLTKPTLQVIYARDVLPPSVQLTAALGDGRVSSPFTVSVASSDPAPGGLVRLELLVDGEVIEARSVGLTQPNQFSIDPRTVGPGQHTMVARAIDGAGNSTQSSAVQFTSIIPGAPQNLTLDRTSGVNKLRWLAPAVSPEIPSEPSGGWKYNVYRSANPKPTLSDVDRLTPSPITQMSFDIPALGLNPPLAYYYFVTAIAGAVEGVPSGLAQDLSFTPGVPTIRPVNGTYELSWLASSRPGVTYNVYRGAYSGFVPSAANRIATGVASTSLVDGKNNATNGSFEDGSTTPTEWTANSGAAIRDTDVAKFGSASLRMTQLGNASAWSIRKTKGPVTISAYSKLKGTTGNGASGWGLYVALYNNYGMQFYATVPFAPSGVADTETDWLRAQISWPPAGSQVGEEYTVRIRLTAPDVLSGSVWFDGVQIETGTSASAFVDSFPTDVSPYYRVSAVDGPVESLPSAENAHSVPSPGPLTGYDAGPASVLLNWTPAPQPGLTYNIYRDLNGTKTPVSANRIASVTGTTYKDGVNRVTNGGFERQDSAALPRGWWRFCSYSTECAGSLGGHSGDYSLSVNRTSTSLTHEMYFASNYSQVTTTPFTLSAWSRSEGVAGGSFSSGEYSVLVQFNGSGGVVGQMTLDFAPNTMWNRKAITFTPSAPITSYELRVVIRGNHTGKFWFDDVQLEEGTAATDWREGLGDTYQPSYLVRAVYPDGTESSNNTWLSVWTTSPFAGQSHLTGLPLGGRRFSLSWLPTSGNMAIRRTITYADGSQAPMTTVASGVTGGGFLTTGKNLALNGDFNTNGLAGWTVAADSATTQQVSSGMYSAAVYRSSNTSPEARLYQDITLNQLIAVPLTLSGLVSNGGLSGSPPSGAISSDPTAGLRIELYDSPGNLVGSGIAGGPLPAASGLTQVSVTVTPSAPAARARVTAFVGGNHSSWLMVDQVQLEGGTQRTTFVDDGLDPNVTYTFIANQIDATGRWGGVSNPVDLRVPVEPAPPVSTAVRNESGGGISLSWHSATDQLFPFDVHRLDGDGRLSDSSRVAVGLTVPGFVDPANMVDNASFEGKPAADGLPQAWQWTNPGIKGVSTDTTASKFGKASLMFDRPSTLPSAQGISTTINLDQAEARPVTLSAWSKTTSVAAASDDYSVAVTLLGDSGVVGTGSLRFASSTNWTQQAVAVTPTAPAKSAVIRVIYGGTRTGRAWFDGIQLQPGVATSPAFVPGPMVPGKQYKYRVAASSPFGSAGLSEPLVVNFLPWRVAGPAGEAPGLGLDDRWSFVDMPVPGGTAYLNTSTGNLVVMETDSVLTGPHLAEVIRRTYNSLDPAGTQNCLPGNGWSLNTRQTLSVQGNVVVLTEGDGTRISFTQKAGDPNTYVAPPSVWMKLTSTGGVWTLTRRDGVKYEFDSQLRLSALSEPNNGRITYRYSANALEIEGVNGRITRLGYDGDRLISATDGAGRSFSYGYDTNGRLSRVTLPGGQSRTYTYRSDGCLTGITDAAGRGATFDYWPDAKLKSFGWTGEGLTTFNYVVDQGYTTTTIRDPLQNTSVLTTNRTGNLLTLQDALGYTTQYAYDTQQRMVSVKNARGLLTEITYEAGEPTPRVASVIRHADVDIVTSYHNYNDYDQPGEIVEPLTDGPADRIGRAEGAKTTITYLRNQPLSVQVSQSGLSSTTSFTYRASDGMPQTVTDPNQGTTQYEVDVYGRVVSLTNPMGGRTVMGYDAAGNLTSVTDPNGYTTRHEYDWIGRRTRTTYPDGGQASWSYDASGLLVSEGRPGGEDLRYSYDTAGRLIEMRNGANDVTRFAYDAAGRQTLVWDPNGIPARRDYDAVGQVVRVYAGDKLNPDGQPLSPKPSLEYTYDEVGNVKAVKLANGYTVSAAYDILNRIVSETSPPATTRYTYDVLGRKTKVQDGNGKWTLYVHDGLGRLSEVCDAANLNSTGGKLTTATDGRDSLCTRYTYDPAGNRTSVTVPSSDQWKSVTTKFEYNALGKLSKEIDPIGQVTLYSYDRAGRLADVLDRNGNSISYEYDPMGRPLTIQYGDWYDTVKYTYDGGGRRLTMQDLQGLTQYGYDAAGRLTSEVSAGGSISYTYDPGGRRTAMTFRDGTVRYEYDRANRLTRLTDVGQMLTTFTYGESGELLETVTGAAKQINTYDSATNRISERRHVMVGTGTLLQAFQYGYDNVGNIVSLVTKKANTADRLVDYKYDDLHRLVVVRNGGATGNGRTFSEYAYDPQGNRLSETNGAYTQDGYDSKSVTDKTLYDYSPSGWLLRSTYTATVNGTTSPPKTTTYSYDGAGNLILALGPDRFERYEYNARGLVTKVQVNNQFTYNTYDGDGRRVRRRVINSDTSGGGYRESVASSANYQYDGLYVVAERDGYGSLRTAYGRVPGSGRPVSWYQPQANQSGGVLTDHLGSVVALVDKSAVPVNAYDYDVFGKLRSATETVANDVKFTGAVLDGTGLYHLNARFYNPGIGRFITQDSYRGSPWQPWTQNLYTYVGNNPVNYVDPTGHVAESPWDLFSLMLSLEQFANSPGILSGLAVVVDGVTLAIPVVPGGAGALLKGSRFAGAGVKVIGTIDKVTNSKTLGTNLVKALGLADKPAGMAAHHIVMGGIDNLTAEASRRILYKFGIGINDAANGVFLTNNQFHSRIHKEPYIDWVHGLLKQATSAEDVKAILAKVGDKLGSFNQAYDAAKTAGQKQEVVDAFFDSITQ